MLSGDIRDETIVPESSPIRAAHSRSGLARSRSCLFSSKYKDSTGDCDSSPAVAGTPLKKKSTLPFPNDGDTEVEPDDVCPGIGQRAVDGDNYGAMVEQTPVRARPGCPSSLTLGSASTRLDFLSRNRTTAAEGVAVRNLNWQVLDGTKRAWTSTGEIPQPLADQPRLVEEVCIYESLGWEDENPLF